MCVKYDPPEPPERLEKVDEDGIDVRFDPIPRDPKRLQGIYDNVLAGFIGGLVVFAIGLIVGLIF